MNRMYGKRIGALCLALLMLLCLPLQTFAAGLDTETLPVETPDDSASESVPAVPKTPEADDLLMERYVQVKLFQNGDLDAKQTVPGEVELFAVDGLYELLYQGLLDMSPEIDVSSLQIDFSLLEDETFAKDFQDTFERVINDNPQLFFVDKSYNIRAINGIITSIVPAYYEKLATTECKAEFDQAVKNALAWIDDAMTPLEKTVTLHDYLVLNCFYNKAVGADQSLGPEQVGLEPWTAYGALVNGDPVCEGYSLAYKYLLNQVGIESLIVGSDDMGHAWNLVQLDDEWYHVDVTWDDPTPDAVGQCLHNNFLLSDEGIASTGHGGWEILAKCNSPKYESGYVFNRLPSPLYWRNEKNYYVVKTKTEGVVTADNYNSYHICAGPLEADSTQTEIIGTIKVFMNYMQGEGYIPNNFGITWWGDSLYYVNPDQELVCFNLSSFEEKEIGKIEDFTPTGAHDYGPLWDTICLRYKDGKIQAVSKSTLAVLGEFVHPGDADKNGSVTNDDWTAVAKYLADWNGYTAAELNLAAADVNKDNSVTSADRMILARHLAGWEDYSDLPYAPSPETPQSDPDTNAVIVVGNAVIQEDNTADVTISLKNNPGVASMLLRVSFDETALTLENVTDAGLLGTKPMHSDKRGTPYTLSWTNDTAEENLTANGTIVTLHFRLKEGATEDSYPISVQYASEEDEILDKDMNPVSFQVVDGTVHKKTTPSLGTLQADGNTLRISIENLEEESKLAFAFYNGEQFLGIGVQDISSPGEYSMESLYDTATRATAMLLNPEWQILCTKAEADLTPPDEAERGIAAILTDSEGNIVCIKREVALTPPDEAEDEIAAMIAASEGKIVCIKREVELTPLPE